MGYLWDMWTKSKNNWLYWLVQVIGWGAYTLIFFGLVYMNGGIIFTNKLVLYFIVSLALAIFVSHLARLLIIRFNWLNRSVWQIIVFTIIGAIITAFIFELAQLFYSLYVVTPDYYVRGFEFEPSQLYINVFISFIVFSLWYGFYYTYLFIERSRKQEIKNLQFEASRNEIELKNLRAQINPHFLFNSLNSIKALVEIDKEGSKAAITKLSNLLRNSIHLSKNRLISLREELEIVKTYLDLEKIRFEDHIRLSFDIDEDSLDCKVPPLMLQTVTENAIKHGLSKLIDGGELLISSRVSNDQLIIKVVNTGKLDIRDDNHGIGIENTRKRLAIIYGEDAYFNLFELNKMVHAHIEVKKIVDEN